MGTPSVTTSQWLTKRYMNSENADNMTVYFQGRPIRPPLRTIYIHSVAKRDFRAQHFLYKKLTLAGCANGERYVTCMSLPDPVTQLSPDIERGGTRSDEHDGWRVAIDILNPVNTTTNPYAGADNPQWCQNTSGTNLVAEGIFPSLNEVPTDEELRRAEKARDDHYRYLTKEASRLAAVSTSQLNDFLQRYPDTHTAMDALGMEANWHTKNEVKNVCPNCGDSIKGGIAFHQSTAGILCVIDPLRAWKAGAISKERYEEMAEVVSVDANGDMEPETPRRTRGPRIGRNARDL